MNLIRQEAGGRKRKKKSSAKKSRRTFFSGTFNGSSTSIQSAGMRAVGSPLYFDFFLEEEEPFLSISFTKHVEIECSVAERRTVGGGRGRGHQSADRSAIDGSRLSRTGGGGGGGGGGNDAEVEQIGCPQSTLRWRRGAQDAPRRHPTAHRVIQLFHGPIRQTRGQRKKKPTTD